jgi:uncharacterized HAD superfamily protein
MYEYTGNNWSHRNTKKVLKKNLETTPVKHSINSLKKDNNIGTSHTIRKVLQAENESLSHFINQQMHLHKISLLFLFEPRNNVASLRLSLGSKHVGAILSVLV